VENNNDDLMKLVHNCGLKTGRAQAFQGIALLAEFLQWKAMQEIVDDKKTLNNMGYSNIDDYLKEAGFGKTDGYKKLKIARTFSSHEVQFFGQIGLSKGDLLSIANMSPEERPRIANGKLENYDTADKDELKHIIDDLIAENIEHKKQAKGYSENKIVKKASKLEADNKTLHDKVKTLNLQLRLADKSATAFQDAYSTADELLDQAIKLLNDANSSPMVENVLDDEKTLKKYTNMANLFEKKMKGCLAIMREALS